jgi:hypothetical protein
MVSACTALIATGSLQAQALAKLAHRFTFEGNAVDVVEGMPGIRVTGNEGLQEPPVFEAVVPPGATGPTKSMRVGMHYGQKKSGVMLPPKVFDGLAEGGSVTLFAKLNSAPEHLTFLLNSGPVDESGFVFRIKAPGKVDVRVNGLDSGESFAPFDLPPGRWTHVALVWKKTAEGVRVAVSANGEPVATRTLPQSSITGKVLAVGGLSHNNVPNGLAAQFDGHIYDLQIYNGALSPSEIAALAAKPGTTR